MPVTDAERLRAAGHVVKLADGEYPLVYDFGALLLLEQEVGGLAGINRIIESWTTPTGKKAPDNPVKLAELRTMLAAGLAHVPLTAAEVVRGFLLSNLGDYMSAIDLALAEAFLPAVDGQGNGRSEEATSSNGTRSTSSPQSDMAEATATSGG